MLPAKSSAARLHPGGSLQAAKAALLRKIQDPKNGGQLQPGKMHDNAPFLNRGLAFASKAWKVLRWPVIH